MTTVVISNETRVITLIQILAASGIDEFCVCPGSRNSPLVSILERQSAMRIHYWFEERSAAYFALGRSKLLQKPVAVVTTSGTAAGELLPAVMEAHYTGIPLLCITADRPSRFRNTGAPQTAEQVGLYGPYVQWECDIEEGDYNFDAWEQTGPAHINICFEEPSREVIDFPVLTVEPFEKKVRTPASSEKLDRFFATSSSPYVVVSTLKEEDREAVVQFLLHLQAPVYLEGISGLREDVRLGHLQSNLKEMDAVLRIGGVPTFRFWRNLEDLEDRVQVLSINDVPFSGLSRGDMIHTPIGPFFERYAVRKTYGFSGTCSDRLLSLYKEEPFAEESLVHKLSNQIPSEAMIYLGNSLPIREWDSAATQKPHPRIYASRGVNGIDGQISTFLGLCEPNQENWALIGDLTALYDMAAFWILPQMKEVTVTVVVINNGGGKIFERMYPSPVFLNQHQLSFKPLAEMWGLNYECWREIPQNVTASSNRLIELIPDNEATKRLAKQKGVRYAG